MSVLKRRLRDMQAPAPVLPLLDALGTERPTSIDIVPFGFERLLHA